MEPASTIKIIESTLVILEDLLKHIPDFEQRKKKQLIEYKVRYEEEKTKDFEDMDLVLNLRDEILIFYEVWAEEIKSKPKAG